MLVALARAAARAAVRASASFIVLGSIRFVFNYKNFRRLLNAGDRASRWGCLQFWSKNRKCFIRGALLEALIEIQTNHESY